jgi:hypothetical protein
MDLSNLYDVNFKVDLYSGCDSDATSNEIVAMKSDAIAKSLLFCRVATIVFSSSYLVILITFFMIIPPLPGGGGGILFYFCPSVLPSVQDIFRRIFLSNYRWQKSDNWSQASYR